MDGVGAWAGHAGARCRWRGFQLAATTRASTSDPAQPQQPGPLQHCACGHNGDGRKLPFKDQAFDLVYSNSVIEHLGTWENQQAFAAECKRAGRSYYIQTPNRWFPIEPHYIAFFVHWLPRRIRRRILRHFTLWGWLTRPTQADCDAVIAEIRLLTHKELQALFPEATIWRERVFGLTKSLIAVNHQPPQKRLEYGPAEN